MKRRKNLRGLHSAGPGKLIYVLFARRSSPFWLEASDEAIINLLHHELLHIEMRCGDFSTKFHNECIRRGIHVNENAAPTIYAINLDKAVTEGYLSFNLKYFNQCFPESFKYWSSFLKIQ